MPLKEAARLTDQISHSSAMAGLLVGVLAGLAVAVAVVAIVGTGGMAAVAIGAGIAAAGAGGGLSGAYIGEAITSPTGQIITGSLNAFVENLSAARAVADTAQCRKEPSVPKIAQGSSNVFINSFAAARKGDKLVCGSSITLASQTVFIGGETTTYLEIDEEVPAWLRNTLFGIMVVGTIIATGGAALVFGWGAALGGLGGGLIGGAALGWVGGKIGGAVGGELGARIGETVGGLVGGFAGGIGGARLGSQIGAGSPKPLTQLRDEAAEVLGTSSRYKSTAVGEYEDGSLGIASSDQKVPRVQREWAEENGVRVVNGPGHAEETLRNGATSETGPLRSLEVDSPHGRNAQNPNGAICLDCEQNVIRPNDIETSSPYSGRPSRGRR